MGQLLGNVAVGTVLKLNESGSPQNYIVVHQGKPSSMYDDSCDGTWLLRQNIYSNKPFNSLNLLIMGLDTSKLSFKPNSLHSSMIL